MRVLGHTRLVCSSTKGKQAAGCRLLWADHACTQYYVHAPSLLTVGCGFNCLLVSAEAPRQLLLVAVQLNVVAN